MDSLYHQTNRQLQELTQQDLSLVDQAQSFTEFQTIESTFNRKLESIYGNVNQLDILVAKEPPQRRTTAKYRVDQLKYDLQHILSSFKALQHKRLAMLREREEREGLLSRKFTTNDEASTSIFIDHELKHHTSLQDSNRNLDELLSAGSSVLSNLRDQGSLLKGAQKRMLDIANTLGLSNTVMRLIERRTTQDKYILYGGMIVVLVILFMIVRYL